jgi:hypothetical protein
MTGVAMEQLMHLTRQLLAGRPVAQIKISRR